MNTIDIGDEVTVRFTPDEYIEGKVLYMPQATGDCWHIKENNGNIHYIQTFQHIIKYSTCQKV